jgi:hypothetical protein
MEIAHPIRTPINQQRQPTKIQVLVVKTEESYRPLSPALVKVEVGPRVVLPDSYCKELSNG